MSSGKAPRRPRALDDRVVDLVALAAEAALAHHRVLHRRSAPGCSDVGYGPCTVKHGSKVSWALPRRTPASVRVRWQASQLTPARSTASRALPFPGSAVPLDVGAGRVAAQAPLTDAEHVLVGHAERRLVQRIADGVGHHRRRPSCPRACTDGRRPPRRWSGSCRHVSGPWKGAPPARPPGGVPPPKSMGPASSGGPCIRRTGVRGPASGGPASGGPASGGPASGRTGIGDACVHSGTSVR